MDFNRLYKGCFHEKPQVNMICPYCGFNEMEYTQSRKPEVLPPNTILRGAYIVGKCLGVGGFGITYLGWHINLDTVVAIKEFFPVGIVARDTSRSDSIISVSLANSGLGQTYQKALDGFIKEAKTLGKLRLPGVVRVYDCFEENHTAYIVMDYIQGQDLSHYLKQSGGKLSETATLELIIPYMAQMPEMIQPTRFSY